jgi:glyoxylase-like metal-dependent hydrolase (beta-lactamase superfamily II)
MTSSAQDAPTTAKPELSSVAKGVWMIRGSFPPKRQPDANTVIFEVARAQFVVMDTGRHKWHRQAILDFVASRHGTVVAIINSVWHLDHVSGNPDLKRAYPGAKVYASRAIDGALKGFLPKSVEDTRPYLEAGKLPPETLEDLRNDIATIENGAALRPDVPVDASMSVRFGKRTLRLNLAPNAVTDGDVWVYDHASGILAAGNLVTLPTPFLDTACPEGWRRGLDQVWATPFTELVPSHGSPMTRTQFSTYRKAYGAVIDCAKTTRPKADCAVEWAKSVEPLLGPDPTERQRARDMTAYYVQDVLRANGGKSPICKAA